ncbi:hypothetical protein F2Q69_00035462 [Brassica cretica]|uniref:Uncharacterized protein n=1 Tax=Brassica cretica TaxID=69181 RepID=A0A8S9SGQ0_BRACR|nr:hypothetical protein F2Q69_00035462 [Brassica cretica]
MISLRICVEFCAIKGKFSLTLSDLLPKTHGARRFTCRSFLLQSLAMEDSLQLSLQSMKIVDDEEPLTLPDSPRIRVFDENSTSLLELVFDESNKVASFIANSVTKDQRLQSYIGSGGPSWLQTLISQESGFDSS